VSAQHARIEQAGPDFVVQDLGSRNGTYVNGRRIQGRVPLRAGDELRVGDCLYIFLVEPAETRPRKHALGPARPPLAGADEKLLLAALCHGAALFTISAPLVPLVSAAVPLAIWLLVSRHSAWLGFHARQAALYQATVSLVLLLARPVLGPPIWLLTTGYAWFGAFNCARGQPFRYPLLGALAEAWS
jgi:uncharacterized membrane protein